MTLRTLLRFPPGGWTRAEWRAAKTQAHLIDRGAVVCYFDEDQLSSKSFLEACRMGVIGPETAECIWVLTDLGRSALGLVLRRLGEAR